MEAETITVTYASGLKANVRMEVGDNHYGQYVIVRYDEGQTGKYTNVSLNEEALVAIVKYLKKAKFEWAQGLETELEFDERALLAKWAKEIADVQEG